MENDSKELLFKALCGYLPYKLKLKALKRRYRAYNGCRTLTEIFELYSVSNSWNPDVFIGIDGPVGFYNIDDFKPLLLPLSHLTEEIEHNGERFVPVEKLKWMFDLEDLDHHLVIEFETKITMLKNCMDIIEKLFEWHFDVYGLIEKGLAIDKTTVKIEQEKD